MGGGGREGRRMWSVGKVFLLMLVEEGNEEEEEGHARGCIHFHRGYFSIIIESGTVCFYIFFFYFVEQQQRD